MNYDGKIVIMGINVGAPGYYPGAGFKEIPCADCGKNCWLGPKQQEKLTELNAIPACMLCVIKEFGAEAVPVPLVENSGSHMNREEMRFGEWPEAQKLVEEMRRKNTDA